MKCSSCPLSTRPGPCPALTRPHPRYCQLVDPGHRDHDPAYRAILVAMVDAGPTDSPPPRPSPAPSPIATYDPRLGRVLGCSHRESTCHCLHKPARCRRDDRSVELADCLACVTLAAPRGAPALARGNPPDRPRGPSSDPAGGRL